MSDPEACTWFLFRDSTEEQIRGLLEDIDCVPSGYLDAIAEWVHGRIDWSADDFSAIRSVTDRAREGWQQ